jgi:predicted permease
VLWRDWWLRVRAIAFRNRVERELDEELDFHVAMQTRKNLGAGMSEAEAARQARLEFGREAGVKEECRDARGIGLVETLWQDVRYAIRGFRRTPLFALTVVATIGLGLGFNTTFFTVFNAYALRPLEVRDPYSLYAFEWVGRDGRGFPMSWSDYREFNASGSPYSETFAYRDFQSRLNGEYLFGQLVTGGYFRMLGVGAAMGRTLLPEDTSTPGGEAVMVLSYAAWKDKFGADPAIVGKKLLVHGYPLEVIGVARAGFAGLDVAPQDFWAPLTMSGALADGPDLFGPAKPEQLWVGGRLRPGVSQRQAQAALSVWARNATSDRPDSRKAVGVVINSLATSIPLTPRVLAVFSPIIVAFGLVLLTACANVANMMLARALARQREIGIRLSLGASRGRLIRQLLIESLLLALPGAAAAFAISEASIHFGERLLFSTLPPEFAGFIRLAPVPPDARVFGFMVIAAVICALAFGLAPAVQATRGNVVQAARGDFTNDHRPARLRNALVVAQVTTCVVLLITTGVLLRTAMRMQKLDTGLRTWDTIEFEIREKFRPRILAHLESEPLVQMTAAAGATPLNGQLPSVPVTPAGSKQLARVSYNFVSPEYFAVFDIPVLRGRNFTAEEAAAGVGVVVISQATAQRLWPNQDPLGQSLRVAPEIKTSRLVRFPVVRVVGTVPDVVSGFIGFGKDATCVYFPTNSQANGNAFLVRVHGDPESARRKLDAGLAAIDPTAVEQIHKMQEYVSIATYPFQVAYWVSAAIGGLALLLTLSGIYGVLSYVVSQRKKEIGIRMALGASTQSVTGLVLKQCLRLAALGIALGTALALAVSRIFSSLLVLMKTYDAPAYIGAMLLVLAACLAAAWAPSRRAARIDPLDTLRYD